LNNMKYELHLDPPLDHPGITMENHDYLELSFDAPEHIAEWFLNLPEVKDRIVCVYKNPQYAEEKP